MEQLNRSPKVIVSPTELKQKSNTLVTIKMKKALKEVKM